MTMVSKHATVLNFDGFQSNDREVVFIKPEDEGSDAVELEEYRMDAGLWHDMNQPEVITLTVVPGDILNPETPADYIGGKRVGGYSAQDV